MPEGAIVDSVDPSAEPGTTDSVGYRHTSMPDSGSRATTACWSRTTAWAPARTMPIHSRPTGGTRSTHQRISPDCRSMARRWPSGERTTIVSANDAAPTATPIVVSQTFSPDSASMATSAPGPPGASPHPGSVASGPRARRPHAPPRRQPMTISEAGKRSRLHGLQHEGISAPRYGMA